MEEAIWSLAKADIMFAEPIVIVVGGTHSGRSKLLEFARAKAASNIGSRHRLPILCSAPPYQRTPSETESRLAAGIVHSLNSVSQLLPEGHQSAVSNSLTQALYKQGIPVEISRLLDEPSLRRGYKASFPRAENEETVLWALEVASDSAGTIGAVPYLLLDDANRLPPGTLTTLMRISKERAFNVVVTARSLTMTEYDTPNPFESYLQGAYYLCLDFHPGDADYREACISLLRRRAHSVSGEQERAIAQYLLAKDTPLLEVALGLSCGQLGRFTDFLRFLGDIFRDRARFKVPSRTLLQRFCRTAFEEIIQKEPSEAMAISLRKMVTNLDRLADLIDTSVSQTWLFLGWRNDASVTPIDCSLARCSVLNWLLHAPTEERIKVAIDSKFVPTKVKISPMAAVLGGLPLSKIWQSI